MTGINFKFNLSNIGYRIIRTESRLFDITDCQQLLDGHVNECSALLKDAKEMQPHVIADLVAESEERDQQLQDVEGLLREWINLRRSRTRKAVSNKEKPKQFQKKEVVK